MLRIHYTARLKGHKSWSVQGIAHGETIKRFNGVVLNRNKNIDFICINSISECKEEEVFKSELKLAKKTSLKDLLSS